MNIQVEQELDEELAEMKIEYDSFLSEHRGRSKIISLTRSISRIASRLGWTDQELCVDCDGSLLLWIRPTRDSEFEVRIGYDDKFDLVINDCSEGGVDSVDIEGTTLSDVIQRMHDMALAIRQQPASNTIVIPQTFEATV